MPEQAFATEDADAADDKAAAELFPTLELVADEWAGVLDSWLEDDALLGELLLVTAGVLELAALDEGLEFSLPPQAASAESKVKTISLRMGVSIDVVIKGRLRKSTFRAIAALFIYSNPHLYGIDCGSACEDALLLLRKLNFRRCPIDEEGIVFASRAGVQPGAQQDARL